MHTPSKPQIPRSTLPAMGATGAKMNPSVAVDVVKRFFASFQAGDRAALESAMTDTFRFSSPVDDRIDKKTYFERCFPNARKLGRFELEDVVANGERVLVRYLAHRRLDGSRFRNTEVFTVHGGKIDSVEVYFGRDLDRRDHDDAGDALSPVIAVLDAHAESLRAKDVEKTVALYAPTSTEFALAPPLATTERLEQRRTSTRAWFDTWASPILVSRRELDLDEEGDLAVTRALIHMTGTKVGGENVDLWFRQTMVLRRIEDQWRIVHEHASVPFDMTTMAACLDLRP